MNVLLLSIGAKRALVSFFKDTLSGFDRVITTDCSPNSAGLYESDAYYLVPRMNEDNYLPTLIEICKKEKIGAVIPLQEDELLLISSNRNLFEEEGITVISSDAQFVSLCRDKFGLYEYLSKKGIPCVPTSLFTEECSCPDIQFPVFIKPRYGAGSVGNMKISSRKLLEATLEEADSDLIIQPFKDAKEFGVDVYVDLISKEVTDIFVKEKIRMRAGETEKSLSVSVPQIEDIVKNILTVLPLCGPLDMDFFLFDGEYYLLEINPRFGGGYPHAFMCGANFPLNISNNLHGLKNGSHLGKYDCNKVALKYTQTMIIDNR